ITTTDQTNKASAVTNISQTTDSLTTILSSTKEPRSTAASTGEVSTNSASGNERKDNLVMNPGLVAILCIFFIALALVLVVAIAKIISYRRNSQFERLEDLPMSQQSKVNENAPFARYPPK
ncbi:A-agglutinin anchorage subunit-like, partial [Tachysurus ichikawai]